jgi:D-beta-D-heptose 7-phosphate kinase / D-beta-D-heptose 1-phosphate adenosyltransferase
LNQELPQKDEMLKAFKSILERISETQIICVGDVMLDRYVHGEAHRISPEAPIPVLSYTHNNFNPGGAANVAANLAALAVRVHLLGRVGADNAAHDLSLSLQRFNSIQYDWLIDNDLPTTEKTRFVVGGQQLLRVDREKSSPISAIHSKKILDLAFASIEKSDVLIISDYAKGLLTDDICQALIQRAIDSNIPVMVDPKGQDYRKYKGATLITPNLTELRTALGRHVFGDSEVVAAAKALMQKFRIQSVLVTRSADGMTLVSPDYANGLHIRSTAREVSDVSGAGDTVIAVLAMGVSLGLSLEKSAQLANLAAGISVAKHGTVQVSIEEIYKELISTENVTSFGNIYSEIDQKLFEQVANWKSEGLRVGFTNGCFDLLHLGHIHSLKQAKKQCDKLIVALNSDSSVRKIKGPTRPVQDQETRANVLTSLRMVDAVVIFNEDTPSDLIEALMPQVMFKGSDYQNKDVAGAKALLAAGGEVVFIELLQGYSTTSTVQKINSP